MEGEDKMAGVRAQRDAAIKEVNRCKDRFVTISRRFANNPSATMYLALINKAQELQEAQNKVNELYEQLISG